MKFLGLDSPFKVALFSFYVVMWALQGILVHRANKSVRFSASGTVLIQEFSKMVISVILFLSNDGGIKYLFSQIRANTSLCIWYFVPALLYAVYNNLTFIGLQIFDPASYFVLMQFRIVLTGLMSIALLRKAISGKQWVALVIVMVGAMFKELPNLFSSVPQGSVTGYVVVFVQLTLSALAGVFNEKLLKGRSDTGLNLQNIFMYVDSILLNLVLFVFAAVESTDGDLPYVANPLMSEFLLPVILNASFLGVLTGFFLKHLSSVLKSIAAAVELWVTAVFASVVFGYAINAVTVAGIAIVSTGVYMYSVAPVPTEPTVVTKTSEVELGASPIGRE